MSHEQLIAALTKLQSEKIVLEFQVIEPPKGLIDSGTWLSVKFQLPSVQKPAVEINEIEEIKIFCATEKVIPTAFVRENFPSVPHLTIHPFGLRTLCLYDDDEENILSHFDTYNYCYQIYFWLERSRLGLLHFEEDPLEPIVLGFDGFVLENGDQEISLLKSLTRSSKKLYIANYIENDNNDDQAECIRVYSFNTQVNHQGTHYRFPTLLQFLQKFQGIESFREAVINKVNQGVQSSPFAIRIDCTIKHPSNGTDTKQIFYIESPGADFDFAEKVGWIAKAPGETSYSPILFVPKNTVKMNKQIIQELLDEFPTRLLHKITPPSQAIYSKSSSDLDSTENSILQIGCGSLGGQYTILQAMSGRFSKYTLFDPDHLMPHNLARWPWVSENYGRSKVSELGSAILRFNNNTVKVEKYSTRIQDQITLLEDKKSSYNLIVDMSASFSAQRFLDNQGLISNSPRITAFMNGTGAYSVLFQSLSPTPHSVFETALYRYFLDNKYIAQIFSKETRTNPYGPNGCANKSHVIPTDLISLHTSTISRLSSQINEDSIKFISVNQDGSTSVTNIEIPRLHTFDQNTHSQSVYVHSAVIEEIRKLRASALPNETGGILVGFHHAELNRLYIVKAYSAPPNSQKSPASFERAPDNDGLIMEANRITSGMINYVGEWHSHPSGASSDQSEWDKEQSDWLNVHSSTLQFDYVQLIVSDNEIKIF